VGEYLLSVGNIQSIPDRKSYHDFSLLEEIDSSLISVPLD
jgi:NitT/TauT family transport system substrate-binding protein